MRALSLLTLFSLVLTFTSCEEEEAPGIVNTWKLVAQLLDPGDGSGQFQDVESNKTIRFYDDSTFTSNGFMCQMSTAADTSTSGTYDPTEMTITPYCGFAPYSLSYSIEGDYLIVQHFCIEPCKEKYALVD